MKINIFGVTGCTQAEARMVYDAAELVGVVTRKLAFKELLAKETLTEVGKLTVAEIQARIDGAEISVKVAVYDRWWSKVVGWVTGANADTIHVNRKYMKSVESVASNLLHESSHILGFPHRFSFKTSLPYALNRVFMASVKAGV